MKPAVTTVNSIHLALPVAMKRALLFAITLLVCLNGMCQLKAAFTKDTIALTRFRHGNFQYADTIKISISQLDTNNTRKLRI